ncbi:TIGR01777 family oxidoreductase [Pseudomonas seleniipraecipitans]|uniref:TIGR01777 family oxidoreductase n=1 Tax=Phytopseudomonas seleniipraecipitans TaxID=640205 RepID=A0ABY5J5R7_9GAMM|nr:TIGR01777 family oxidoreductase [Pseudomonas seleniipraecipitans]UUD63242.1 TIGR01777 family oxidoreductase [Pseudomonas seleniipraecipitans]
MHILITGGTGLIGRALCHYWIEQGHQLTVWSRRPEQVAVLCGTRVRGVGRLEEIGDEPLDAVVNLAGAPIADRPWSKARRQLLWESRVHLTETLLAWLQAREQKPGVLLSGSAVGWYGDTGERHVDEQAAPGADFAAQLCVAWEDTAQQAEALGIRVILLRTGLVLAKDGGILKRMVTPFRFGLGGRIGNGRQWMPWIHIADQIALIDFLLQQEQARGPYNACAPQPVRNAEFASELGHAVNRPAIVPLPAFALRAGLGEMSLLLLGGQHAQPARALEAGFDFRFTHLDVALVDLLSLH